MNPMVKMVLTLAVITALAAAALAGANMATADKIKAEAEAKAARAVLKIFPDCTAPAKSEEKSPSGETLVVYRCPSERVCFSFSTASDKTISRPYSGRIRAMVGIEKGSIAGVQIVEQSETPGLGAKIVEKKFLDQFRGKGANTVWKVKKDDPAGTIDGLSGATISSRAVTTMVEAALRFYTAKLAAAVVPAADPGAAAEPAAPSCGAVPPASDAAPAALGCGAPAPPSPARGHVPNPKIFMVPRPDVQRYHEGLKRQMRMQRNQIQRMGGERDGRPVKPVPPAAGGQ